MAQLGKYQLVAEIARGGMGIVYLAVAHGPARFSKLLVVKELKPELVDDGSFLEMFLEEARLAARLNHPNIVQTYEIGADGNRHYMVMDYLEGFTLARILRKKSERFTLAMQLRVLCEILQGLEYAHSLEDFDGTPLGIVHRDATPQNVFVTFEGTIKLVDFGIAKALDSTVETRTGVLKGKAAYMAPEQMAGGVDPRADVFAVGVMVWEAVAGQRMWHKEGDLEVLTHIMKGEIPSLRAKAPDAPEPLIRIVDRALARDREDRYSTAADFRTDLETYLVESRTDVSARDVGKVVAEMFATERITTRTKIEQYLTSLTTGKPVEKLPSLPPAPLESSATQSGTQLGTMRMADAPSFTPTPKPLHSLMTGAGTPGGAEMPSAASDALLRELAAKKQKTTIGIAAGAGVLILVGIFAFRFGTKSPAAADPSATSAVALSPPPDAAPASHEVMVRVTPADARVTIDGVPLSNPGKRTCAAGQRRSLVVSAPHFITAVRELSCEQDELLDLSLQPEPSAANPNPAAAGFVAIPWVPPNRRAAPAPPPPAAAHAEAPSSSAAAKAATAPSAPTSAGEVSPAGGTKPNRAIEIANPYGAP